MIITVICLKIITVICLMWMHCHLSEDYHCHLLDVNARLNHYARAVFDMFLSRTKQQAFGSQSTLCMNSHFFDISTCECTGVGCKVPHTH